MRDAQGNLTCMLIVPHVVIVDGSAKIVPLAQPLEVLSEAEFTRKLAQITEDAKTL